MFLLLESKGNYAFKKAAKFKGEGKPTLSMRWFPLSLRPSPLPFTDQGSTPGPPYAVPSLFEIGILITEFSESWIRWLWLEGLGKAGLFGCQSGIRGLWLETFGKQGLFGCQSGIRRLWLEGIWKGRVF